MTRSAWVQRQILIRSLVARIAGRDRGRMLAPTQAQMAAVAAQGAEAAVSVVAIEAIQGATVASAAAVALVVVIEAIQGAAAAAVAAAVAVVAAASVAVIGASQVAIAVAASVVVVAMTSAVMTEAFPVAIATRLVAVVRAQAPLLRRRPLLAPRMVRMMTRGAPDLDLTDRTAYSAVGRLPLRHARAHPPTPVRGVSASHLARAKVRLLFQVVMATTGRIRSATLGATSAMMMRQQLIPLLAEHLLPVLQRRVWLQ